MFTKIFIDILINFLYNNLKDGPVTKARIKQLLIVFNSCWKKELREIKYAKKKLP